MHELSMLHTTLLPLAFDPTLEGLKNLIYKGLHNIYFISLAAGIVYAGLIKRRVSLVGEVVALAIIVGLVLWSPEIVTSAGEKLKGALEGGG